MLSGIPAKSATSIANAPPFEYPNASLGFEPYLVKAFCACSLAFENCLFPSSYPVAIKPSVYKSSAEVNLVPRNANFVSFVSGLCNTNPSLLDSSSSIL